MLPHYIPHCEPNAVSSLKNNQSGAVNNLLEEVRKAEETLARERKKANAEVSSVKCLENIVCCLFVISDYVYCRQSISAIASNY